MGDGRSARGGAEGSRFFYFLRGGVTLTGGEPMLQAAFLEGFLPSLKGDGIHVTLETCGHFTWADMERIAPFLDLIYFDLKQMDSARHESYTTRGNELILDNFRRLAAVFPHVQPRMPVIPGCNDDEKNIVATAAFLHECAMETIHCLPYHRMGRRSWAGSGWAGPAPIRTSPQAGPEVGCRALCQGGNPCCRLRLKSHDVRDGSTH